MKVVEKLPVPKPIGYTLELEVDEAEDIRVIAEYFIEQYRALGEIPKPGNFTINAAEAAIRILPKLTTYS